MVGFTAIPYTTIALLTIGSVLLIKKYFLLCGKNKCAKWFLFIHLYIKKNSFLAGIKWPTHVFKKHTALQSTYIVENVVK